MNRMNRSGATSSRLEQLALFHTGALVVAAALVFGGNIDWMRTTLSLIASLGAGLTLAAFLQGGEAGRDARRKAWWLLPIILFSLLVGISATNPTFRTVTMDGETLFVRLSNLERAEWPGTISPEMTLRAWWFGLGAYLSAFNLAVLVQRRSVLLKLLLVIAGLTLVLAVFGTLQKLSGSGFYFGAATSPNPRFFATFIYYNHWGAFMIMGLSVATGLLFYSARRFQGRDLWHSPFSLALVGVLLIATSAPVSASRASTIMAALVAGVALAQLLTRVIKSRKSHGRAVWPHVLLILGLTAATVGGIGWLSHRSINERYTETRRSIDEGKSVLGGRAELYSDTWQLVRQKPVFGWGLDTYAVAFQLVRPQGFNYRDRTENFYATAHSDWLQSLVETGFVGTALLLMAGLAPLTCLRRRTLTHPLTSYPLFGCGLVLAYAWVEFPFAGGAVLITFCVLFFATLRHAELTARLESSRHE